MKTLFCSVGAGTYLYLVFRISYFIYQYWGTESIFCIVFEFSGIKIKVLDASGPPGLPTLLAVESETTVATAISALTFSPDGEVRLF